MSDLRSTLLDLTARLVACDTTSGRPTAPAVALLAEALEARGARVAVHESEIRGVPQQNLVATFGPAAPGGLLLSGHLDTVPFAEQPGWRHDPLTLAVAGDFVVGRGVADMKGFVAACVVALDLLDAAALTRPLVLAFTAEEEVGCLGAAALADDLETLLQESLGGVPLPRLAWIGEPTGWRRHHAHKGIVQTTLRVSGKGGHSSLPDRGVNAIAVAARAVEAIGLLGASLSVPRPEWREVFPEAPHVTLNIGTIRGGTAANMIPDQCTVGLSYRPMPDEDPRGVLDRMQALVAALDLRDFAGGPGRAALRWDPDPLVVPGLASRPDGPLMEALGAAVGAGPVTGAPYATDGGRLAPLGMDVAICGPGELAQAHQPEECIALSALVRTPEVIAQVARRLLGR